MRLRFIIRRKVASLHVAIEEGHVAITCGDDMVVDKLMVSSASSRQTAGLINFGKPRACGQTIKLLLLFSREEVRQKISPFHH